MMRTRKITSLHTSTRSITSACLLAVALAGCTVGPNYVRPDSVAPERWTDWRSADASLSDVPATNAAPAPDWWTAFNDPVLEALERRAFAGSPDLATATLHFAQARAQRQGTASSALPSVDLSGSAVRQRQSEYGASTRMLDAIGSDRDQIAKVLGQPYTLYQAGVDVSWELDLWGKIRRSIEGADADVAEQAAQLDLARLSLAGDVAQNYLELRATQTKIQLARQDLAALEERFQLMEAQERAGTIDHADLVSQRAEVESTRAELPALLAQEASYANQIALLLGERPGALREVLKARPQGAQGALPDLSLGLPSEVARRRPDIRAAEARLHSATASIGVARADLYPSISLGGKFGYESYLGGELSDWGSRTWSVGPSLSLPLFDRGKRKATVQLRSLEQQEAAVAYQKTVLQAWQEIDDALNGYVADSKQVEQLERKLSSTSEANDLAQARYTAGTTDYTTVLDMQRNYLQAQRDLVTAATSRGESYIKVNKSIGNIEVSALPQ